MLVCSKGIQPIGWTYFNQSWNRDSYTEYNHKRFWWLHKHYPNPDTWPQWWVTCFDVQLWKYNLTQFHHWSHKMTSIRWNPDIFPSGYSPETATNTHVFTYFCWSLGTSVIYTHITIVGFFNNDSSIKTPMCPRLHLHGKHVYKFHPFMSLYYFSDAVNFILTQKRRGCMKEIRMPSAYALNLVANSGSTIYGVWSIG